MQKRRYHKLLVIALFCACLLLAVSWLPLAGDTPMASAHSFVVGSDPIDGSTINKAPALVRIYFDAPIASTTQAIVSAFTAGASEGKVVSTDYGTINASNPQELDISLLPANKLPQGGYEIKWTAVSLTDGRTTSGLIGFNLGFSNTGVSGTPTLGPSTSNNFPSMTIQGALSVAWDWLVTLALLFWAGMLIAETIIVPRAIPANLLAQAHKHARPLQALCLAGLLVGEIINLILRITSFAQTSGTSGISLDMFTQFTLNTNYGLFWLARVVLLVAALCLFWWGKDHQQQPASASTLPVSRSNKYFRQFRQQVRAESTPETSGTLSSALSMLTRSQVSGAVAANLSQARATGVSQPRITAHNNTLTEISTYQSSPWQRASQLVLAGLIMLTLALSNEIIHLTPLPISAVLLSWLSLVAQAMWFGCIAYLGFTLLPLQPATNSDQHAEMLIRILKRARPFLISAIGVLLVSELFLNEAGIQTPDQLLNTSYGHALLVRDPLLLLMLVFTASILCFLLPRLQRQAVLLPVVASEMPARRTRTFEIAKTEHTIKRALHTISALAALTLICVALMNFFAPPVVFPNVNYAALVNQANASSSSATPAAQTQTQTVSGLTMTLQVAPARVGSSNTLTLTIHNPQGQTLSNAIVRLAINMQIMNMGTTSATLQSGNPTYTTIFNADQTFTMAGNWLIRVSIDQPGQPTVNATFQVMATA
ncbi:MAG TPA: copper resistance protein CopC [Ktedonobacteraceae bacterium]